MDAVASVQVPEKRTRATHKRSLKQVLTNLDYEGKKTLMPESKPDSVRTCLGWVAFSIRQGAGGAGVVDTGAPEPRVQGLSDWIEQSWWAIPHGEGSDVTFTHMAAGILTCASSRLFWCEDKATSVTGWELFTTASCRLESDKKHVVVRSSQMQRSPPSARTNEVSYCLIFIHSL